MTDLPAFRNPTKRITDALNEVQRERQDRLKLENAAIAAEMQSSDRLGQVLTTLSAETDTALNDASVALSNLERIESLPKFVSGIMSIFDEDFSRTKQKAKIRRSEFTLDTVARRSKAAQSLHNSTISRLETLRKSADLELKLTEDAVSDIKSGLEILQLEGEILDDEAKRALESESVSNIMSGKIANPLLQQRPGLVQARRMQLLAQQGQINLQELNVERTAMQNADIVRQRFLASLTNDELTETARLMASGQAPDAIDNLNITPQDILRQAQSNESNLLELEKAAQENAAGKRDAAKEIISNTLETANMGELLALKTEADNNGGRIDIAENLSISSREIENEIQKLAKNSNLVEQQLELQAANIQKQEIALQLGNIAHLTNPDASAHGADPTNSLPSNIRGRVRSITAQLDVLGEISEPRKDAEGNVLFPSVHTASKQLELLEELQEIAVTERKRLVDEAAEIDDDYGVGRSEFLENGVVVSTAGAAGILANSGNPNLFAGNDILDGVYQDLAAEVGRLQTQVPSSVSSFGQTGVSQTEFVQPSNVPLISQAMQAVNARERLASRMFQATLLETVNTLHEDSKDDASNSIYAGLINKNTGEFNDKVFVPVIVTDAEGNEQTITQFSMANFMQMLTLSEERAQRLGIIDSFGAIEQQIANEFRDRLKTVHDNFTTSEAGAAIMFMAFNNNPAVAINKKFGLMQAQSDRQRVAALKAVQNAQRTDQVLGTVVAGETGGGKTPSVTPPLSSGGVGISTLPGAIEFFGGGKSATGAPTPLGQQDLNTVINRVINNDPLVREQ